MKALGLIETKGLLAAIEGADAMLKSANVSLFEKTCVGGGLVSIAIIGDVGAVKAAVEAGVAAINHLDASLLVSEHVIPRPHEELDRIMGMKHITDNTDDHEETQKDDNQGDCQDINGPDLMDVRIDESPKDQDQADSFQMDRENLQKADLDRLLKEQGIDGVIELLRKLKAVKLKALAHQYDDLEMTDEEINRASKKLLIDKIKAHYQ
ncbi:BMC domain-containing protein [Alkaliphilus crotonatoxidans]